MFIIIKILRVVLFFNITFISLFAVVDNNFTTTWETNVTNQELILGISLDTNSSHESFTIDWGDGAKTTIEEMGIYPTHTYSNIDTYDISIASYSPKEAKMNLRLGNTDSRLYLRAVKKWGTASWNSYEGAFKECSNLEYSITEPIPSSDANSTAYMFYGVKSVDGVSGWDTSTITRMESMFYKVNHFNVDLTNWDTSKVVDMSYMFADTNDTNPDVSTWDISAVTNISSMFNNSSFNQDLSSWVMSDGLDMSYLFSQTRVTKENLFSTLDNWSRINKKNIHLDIGKQATLINNSIKYSDYNYSELAPYLKILINDHNWTISENGIKFSTIRLESIDTIVKPEDFSDNNILFTQKLRLSPAIDDRNNTRHLTYDVNIDETLINAEFNITTNSISFTSKLDKSGIVTVEYNVTDGYFGDSKTFDINITNFDDAPVVDENITSSLSDSNLLLDYTYNTIAIVGLYQSPTPKSITFTLNVVDPEGDTITYSINPDYDHRVITVSIDQNGEVTITPMADAFGSVRFEIIVESNGKVIKQRYDFVIENIPTAPIISYTSLVNQTIAEDSGTLKFDINVSDKDRDDITLSIESNNTLLLTTSTNWTSILKESDWRDTTLDFNLTTVKDAYGVANITIIAKDETSETRESFDIEITPVYDSFSVAKISSQTFYKNFTDKSITFDVYIGDAILDDINYTIATNSNVGLSIDNGILTISSVSDFDGTTDVSIVASDGHDSQDINFTITVLSTEEGSVNPNESITTQVDGTITTTTIEYPDDNLKLEKIIDENSSACMKLISLTNDTSICTDTPLAVTKFTTNGGSISYMTEINSVDLNLSLLAQTTASLDTPLGLISLNSLLHGTETMFTIGIDNYFEIRIYFHNQNYDLTLYLNGMGMVENKIVIDEDISQALSSIESTSSRLLDTGTMVLRAGNIVDGDYVVSGEISIDINGQISTQIIKSKLDSEEVVSTINTLDSVSKYGVGTSSEVKVYDGHIFIKTKAMLTDNIKIQ